MSAQTVLSSGTARALAALALRRDADAWALLLRLHGPAILRATRRILPDEGLAEDACQETLLQIRDRAGQFRGGSLPAEQAEAAARNWIMRIACNTALHILRTRKRARHREEAARFRENPVEIATAAELEEREALARLVRGELAGMPEKQRRPLVLHFFGGLNYEQLAQELQCNVGAARVRVHRALEKLRQRVSALGVVFSATALYSLLESSTAHAADALLGPERLLQWQSLLASTSHAAVNVVSDPQFPLALKTTYTAAVAALCGSLAFSAGGGAPFKPSSLSGPSNPASPSSPFNQRALKRPALPRAARMEMEAMRGAGKIPQAANPRAASAAAAPAARAPRFPELPAPLMPAAPTLAERTQLPASRRLPESPRSGMVSAVAQLKLLYAMQRDLNAHAAALRKKLAVAQAGDTATEGNPSGDAAGIQERLGKLAEDQADIARLILMLADQVEQR